MPKENGCIDRGSTLYCKILNPIVQLPTMIDLSNRQQYLRTILPEFNTEIRALVEKIAAMKGNPDIWKSRILLRGCTSAREDVRAELEAIEKGKGKKEVL